MTLKQIRKKFEREFKINFALDEFDFSEDSASILSFLLSALETAYELGYDAHRLADDVPMGASQWKNHGEKYHYDEFFEEKAYERGKKEGLDAKFGTTMKHERLSTLRELEEKVKELLRENMLTLHYKTACSDILHEIQKLKEK